LPRFVRGLWTIAHWTVTNLICLAQYNFLRPGTVLRVRYEDLVRDPQAELRRIGAFLGIDLAPITQAIADGEPLTPGHNVGGNRLRFASAIQVKEDSEWREHLPWAYRWLFWLIGWPVAASLGYGPGHR
jgi:hypothetical protein